MNVALFVEEFSQAEDCGFIVTPIYMVLWILSSRVQTPR